MKFTIVSKSRGLAEELKSFVVTYSIGSSSFTVDIEPEDFQELLLVAKTFKSPIIRVVKDLSVSHVSYWGWDGSHVRYKTTPHGVPVWDVEGDTESYGRALVSASYL